MSVVNLGTTKHTSRGRLARPCWACLGAIRAGETYYRTGSIYDDRRYSLVDHPESKAETERLSNDGGGDYDLDGGFSEGCLGGAYYDDDQLSPEYVEWRDRRKAEEAGGES